MESRELSGRTGRTVLITGAASGIGLWASVKLAQTGADLVLVTREPVKGARAIEEVRSRSGSPHVSLICCDLASQRAIRALAEEFRARHARLDLLVNNAGTVNPIRRLSEDGIELTFAVNHLGYFLLTHLLMDLLVKSAPARVVNVASWGHFFGRLDFSNLQYEKGGYGILAAYFRSKLCNVLFTRELARRLCAAGVTANCLNPGAVRTPIWSKAPWYAIPAVRIASRFMISPPEGADRIVELAIRPQVEGKTGGYYDRGREARPSRRAQDDGLARQLWDVSLKLTGLVS